MLLFNFCSNCTEYRKFLETISGEVEVKHCSSFKGKSKLSPGRYVEVVGGSRGQAGKGNPSTQSRRANLFRLSCANLLLILQNELKFNAFTHHFPVGVSSEKGGCVRLIMGLYLGIGHNRTTRIKAKGNPNKQQQQGQAAPTRLRADNSRFFIRFSNVVATN